MRDITIATTNPHKRDELTALLKTLPWKVKIFKNHSQVPEVIEDGHTFKDNAIKKALEFSRFCPSLVLADDSGLEVRALNGAPGVMTARFSGPNSTSQKNISKLLRLMKDVPRGKRQARFVCAIALAKKGKIQRVFESSCDGRIAFAQSGQSGFGYDPIFIPKRYRRPFSEFTSHEKHRLSHRGRALKIVKRYLLSLH